jgi:hypothetical protein
MLLSIKVVIYHAQANHQAWRSVSANLPTIDEEFEIHITTTATLGTFRVIDYFS